VTISFGTDGIRGVAGQTPITSEVGFAVGRSAARLAEGGRVLVACDTRPSSAALAAAVASGAAAEGAAVGEAGVAPTSALGVALSRGMAAAGVMITASHNPWRENGFKVLGPGGAKPDDALAARIERWIAECLASEPVHGGPGTLSAAGDEVSTAWQAAMDAATGDLGPLVGKRIALDLANGAAVACLPWLQRLPVAWVFAGDGGGLPNDGVGSEHPEALARIIRESCCEGGFAVDGDADRCVLLDATGQSVPGDAIAWLLARDRSVDGLAVTVMSNGCLEPALPGVRVVRTQVGDRFVREAMIRERLPLGAEESGHVLFDDFPAGDGILTGLRALCAAFRAAPSLAQATSSFRPFPRSLSKVRVARRPPLPEVASLAVAVREGESDLGAGGRIFLRYSGTEPYLRILVEGADPEKVARWSDRVRALATEELT
jgi:phosphoglucosamine mutase